MLFSFWKTKLAARSSRLMAFGRVLNSYEKTQKTASLAAFDGPCLGASSLKTGTVAVSIGLSFFSQNQKNRSITIKILVAIHQVPKSYDHALRGTSYEFVYSLKN